MSKEVTLLEDMSVYKLIVPLTDEVWETVKSWKSFEKETIGMQWVRAMDSVGANTAEGFGRFHYGEKIKFYYYARGSVLESQYWIKRAHKRNLIDERMARRHLFALQSINKELNLLIKMCKSKKS
jgi:four helix bundle protein